MTAKEASPINQGSKKGLANGLGPAQPIDTDTVEPERKAILPETEKRDAGDTAGVHHSPDRSPER